MAKIKKIFAYEIINSRGYPTIEGKLILDNGKQVTTSIPSGISKGKDEALELRDNDPKRFSGKGVQKAVSIINEGIGPKLIGVSPLKQQQIDTWLINADGTKNKSKLGANTILTISQLTIKAAAIDQNIPIFKYINNLYQQTFNENLKIEKIPTPIFNIINGGKHANNNLEFQEYQIIPSSSLNFTTAYRTAIETYHQLKEVLQYRNANVSVGDEGGFTPNFSSNLDGLEILTETILRKDLKPGIDIFLGLDIAASQFFRDDQYRIKDKNRSIKKDEYLKFITQSIKRYPLLTIEDPFSETDWETWEKFTKATSETVYVVGDDLTVTNKDKVQKAITKKACNTILIKPNQIGTITEVLEVINLIRKNQFHYIVSHRSGETNDSFIADLGVGIQSEFVKFGAPSRGERVAKYNRLWQIERKELSK